jgi:hypothetical protein
MVMFDEKIGRYTFLNKTYTTNTSYEVSPGTELTMEHIREAIRKLTDNAILYGTDHPNCRNVPKLKKATLPSKPRLLDRDGKFIREV